MREQDRVGSSSLAGLVDTERARILAGSSPEERDRMKSAERARSVYHAWNTVCAGTREGEHVTGLKFLPDSNELLVYFDSPSWTQEFTMLREIIRARMERAGAHIDGFIFRTSHTGHAARGARTHLEPITKKKVNPAARLGSLTAAEEHEIEDSVSGVEDAALRESLKKAISRSMEWKKGAEAKNKA